MRHSTQRHKLAPSSSLSSTAALPRLLPLYPPCPPPHACPVSVGSVGGSAERGRLVRHGGSELLGEGEGSVAVACDAPGPASARAGRQQLEMSPHCHESAL
eukprot:887550-Rhodomonas_salina.1